MPLEVLKLKDSDFTAISTGDEFKAGVLLWAASWVQTPAASLPDDDRILCRLAQYPMAQWKELREVALHGWVKCSDGRIYHPVIAELALTAFSKRKGQKKRALDGWKARRSHGIEKPMPRHTETDATAMQGTVEGKDKETEESKKKKEPAVPKKSDASPSAPPAVKGTRIPIGWYADVEARAYAAGKGFTEDEIDDMEEGFRLWWPAQPGQKGVKLDWSKTWMTWVRTQLERRQKNGKSGPRSNGAGSRSTEALEPLHTGFMAASLRRGGQ